jgi:hypothetical protein
MDQTKIQQNSAINFFYVTMAVAGASALIAMHAPWESVSTAFGVVCFVAIVSAIIGFMLIEEAKRYGWPSVLKGLALLMSFYGALTLYLWLDMILRR